jgi:hypothetical protein
VIVPRARSVARRLLDEIRIKGTFMPPKLLRVVLLLAIVSGIGCSLPRLLRQNMESIKASTAGIVENTDVVRHSTKVTESLVPAMKGLEGLQKPMQAVAGLNPTLKAVAALDAPMTRVAGLDPSMRAVAALEQPMTRLVEIRPSLDATAALGPSMDRLARMQPSLDRVASLRESMDRVASLQPQLASVADLRGPMDELSTLRQPLERVADLREPMTRLAALGTVLGQPLLLFLLAIAGLVLWGGVTFIAVRLAIVSASRATTARG